MQKYLSIFLLIGVLSCSDSAKETTRKPSEDKEQTQEKPAKKVILFFGNSLTAGMGLEQDSSYPAVIRRKIDSLGLDYEVVNAGLSGETTASGRNRVSWVLNQEVDVFVLELGANDGLRGIPLDETRRNLQAIIDTVRKTNPQAEIILAGMQIPPNMGPEYTAEFKRIFPELAEENDIRLIPFLLKNVAGNPKLNQDDGIHPTAKGQKIVAQNVWRVVGEVVGKR